MPRRHHLARPRHRADRARRCAIAHRPGAGAARRSARPRSGEAVDLRRSGPIDSVLLSHLHADHADLAFATAPGSATGDRAARRRRLARGRRHRATSGRSRRGSRGVGRRRARDRHTGDCTTTGGGRSAARGCRSDSLRGDRSGVYFAGDTDLFEGWATLRGTVDVALLPVWGWGPSVGEGHLDPQRAAQAAAMIGPALAIPIHWGTFAVAVGAGRGLRPARAGIRRAGGGACAGGRGASAGARGVSRALGRGLSEGGGMRNPRYIALSRPTPPRTPSWPPTSEPVRRPG